MQQKTQSAHRSPYMFMAIAFVLAVVHPEAGNIAGGGFLMAHMADGKSAVIDYAFQAPRAFRRVCLTW